MCCRLVRHRLRVEGHLRVRVRAGKASVQPAITTTSGDSAEGTVSQILLQGAAIHECKHVIAISSNPWLSRGLKE